MTQRITIETVHSGQPKPYADHEDVWHVTFEYRNDYREGADFEPDTMFNPEQQPHKALVVLGLEDKPIGRPKDATMDEHFAGWVEHAKHIGGGVVEVFRRTPFCD